VAQLFAQASQNSAHTSVDHRRDVVRIRVAHALAQAVNDPLQAHAVAPLAFLDAWLHVAQ